MELEGAGLKRAGPPWLTFTLLATVTAVFVCEIVFGLDPPTGAVQPSVRTLAAMGASNRDLMLGKGEWFRLFTAPFLHGGLIHLALNGLVLLWVGPIVERLLGRAWFAAVYGASAVAGAFLSMTINPPSVVSVGASGALMGIVACLFVVSFHFAGPVRGHLQSTALRVLVPSLIPLAGPAMGMNVDYGAHAGGAAGGLLIGMIALGSWPHSETLPRLRGVAAVIGAGWLAASVIAAVPAANTVYKFRRDADLRAMLMPNSLLPRTDEQWKAQIDGLAERYPHDPRPRLFRGITMLDARDLAGAQRELRAGLADAQTMKELLPPQVETLLRINLAFAVSRSGQKTEARAIADPVCRLDAADSRPTRTRLKSAGLCD
jgi:rhomboid protease GluP